MNGRTGRWGRRLKYTEIVTKLMVKKKTRPSTINNPVRVANDRMRWRTLTIKTNNSTWGSIVMYSNSCTHATYTFKDCQWFIFCDKDKDICH